MNLSEELISFINEHLNADLQRLALQKNPFPSYDWKWILNQIQAKKKAQKKLPTWFGNDHIVFPSTLSVEQTSSEFLAQYKASLISGNSLIDLTGGFGVDDFYLARSFKKVIHCEFQKELSDIVSHNLKVLHIDNIETVNGDSIAYLEQTTYTFDWIYIDPARRDESKSKVFLLKDCTPDVVSLQPVLFEKSKNILLKAAPLLDVSAILHEINNVKKIYAVGLNNEVKELLIILEKDFNGVPKVVACNIFQNGEIHSDEFSLEDDESAVYSAPLVYLYEPYSSYLKLGQYNSISNRFQVRKLHKHSHLYTSEKLVDFPGRRFKIEQIIPYHKKDIKFLEQTKCNVTTRNFPLKVEDLRKKHKLKDGGDTYLFFTTDMNNEKIVIIAKKETTA